jgi:hypothetical protein
VRQTPVEFDQRVERVPDVVVVTAATSTAWRLPGTGWQPVRTLDATQIPQFENGVAALGDIGESIGDQQPVPHPRPCIESRPEPGPGGQP